MTPRKRLPPAGVVPLEDLKPHPRNYREHPPDQIEHLVASIQQHGFYRNVVIAKDGTILAGHGTVLAARAAGLREVPAVRLNIAPMSAPALKILAADNEISHLAEIDDRELADLLRDIGEADVLGLLGTGYDEMMLANLVFVSRPASEIPTLNAAAEWVGMPEFEPVADRWRIIIQFQSEEDRDKFQSEHELDEILYSSHSASGFGPKGRVRSGWWPPREQQSDATKKYRRT